MKRRIWLTVLAMLACGVARRAFWRAAASTDGRGRGAPEELFALCGPALCHPVYWGETHRTRPIRPTPAWSATGSPR